MWEKIAYVAEGLRGMGEVAPRQEGSNKIHLQRVTPVHGSNIEHQLVFQIKQGSDAERFLNDENAIAQWHQLYAECASSIPFLSPEFAAAWIRHYRHTWTLVLIVAYDAAGLQGIMPLAVQGSLITGVGAHQAEYQGWLCKPNRSDIFLDRALDALFDIFPNHQLRLRYIINSDVNIARSLARRRANVLVNVRSRPLLRLELETIDAILCKRSNKSKVKRMGRQGQMTFERIINPDDLERIFDSIIALYDFRQGAANDSCPFVSDPHKRDFHLDWFRMVPEQLRITCIRLNDEVIGALIGVSTDAETEIAIIAFSVEYARHSPGKILIYYTARLLAEAGQKYLDLTPGDDPWKQRFATEYGLALEFNAYARVSSARRASISAMVMQVGRTTLAALGISPSALKLNAERVRRINLAKIAARVRCLQPKLTEYRIYQIDLQRDFPVYAPTLRINAKVNALDDLVRFVPTQPWQQRQQFLSAALARIESGTRAYTIRKGDTLVHYGWISDYQKKSLFSEVNQSYSYPRPGAVLYEFYTAPAARNRGYYRNTIIQMLGDLKQRGTASVAYISVLADNGPSRHVIESLGFNHIASIFHYQFLWYKKGWYRGDYENCNLQAKNQT